MIRFILSQKNEKELLDELALLLKGRVHLVKSYNGHNMVVHLTNLDKVIKSFTLNKLKTKKYRSYLIWLKVYKLTWDKKFALSDKLEEIDFLRKQINKRIILDKDIVRTMMGIIE